MLHGRPSPGPGTDIVVTLNTSLPERFQLRTVRLSGSMAASGRPGIGRFRDPRSPAAICQVSPSQKLVPEPRGAPRVSGRYPARLALWLRRPPTTTASVSATPVSRPGRRSTRRSSTRLPPRTAGRSSWRLPARAPTGRNYAKPRSPGLSARLIRGAPGPPGWLGPGLPVRAGQRGAGPRSLGDLYPGQGWCNVPGRGPPAGLGDHCGPWAAHSTAASRSSRSSACGKPPAGGGFGGAFQQRGEAGDIWVVAVGLEPAVSRAFGRPANSDACCT
jgi:hypothetical protein